MYIRDGSEIRSYIRNDQGAITEDIVVARPTGPCENIW